MPFQQVLRSFHASHCQCTFPQLSSQTWCDICLELLALVSKMLLASLSRYDGHCDRGASGSSVTALLALVVVLNDLADMSFALCLVRRSLDAVECVRGLDEDGIVYDNLGICPAGWQADIGVSL
jgi:hypothetical protein